MSRVGTLHCYLCGVKVPIGAEGPAKDHGDLVARMFVRCEECEIKEAEKHDQDAQRLAALVEGLRAEAACCEVQAVSAERRGATERARAFAECLEHLDALLREHGFAPEAEVPCEAPEAAANGIPSGEGAGGPADD